MSDVTAKKCDICGAIFTLNTPGSGVIIVKISMVPAKPATANTPPASAIPAFDLQKDICPSCAVSYKEQFK